MSEHWRGSYDSWKLRSDLDDMPPDYDAPCPGTFAGDDDYCPECGAGPDDDCPRMKGYWNWR